MPRLNFGQLLLHLKIWSTAGTPLSPCRFFKTGKKAGQKAATTVLSVDRCSHDQFIFLKVDTFFSCVVYVYIFSLFYAACAQCQKWSQIPTLYELVHPPPKILLFLSLISHRNNRNIVLILWVKQSSFVLSMTLRLAKRKVGEKQNRPGEKQNRPGEAMYVLTNH